MQCRVLAFQSRRSKLRLYGHVSALHIQQIHKWHYEHPHYVHEMPVQSPNLKIHAVVATASVTESHYRNGNAASNDVSEVQAGNAEECGAEQPGAPRIRKQP